MLGENTFRYITEHILSQIGDRDGRISDDHPFSRKEIIYMFLRHRSEVIMSALMEEGEISPLMYQVLDCVDMEIVRKILCPCAPPDGCFWLKSVNPVPKMILTSYITDVRGMEDFTQTTWEDSKRISKSRIKSKRKRRHYFFRENGNGEIDLYVLNDEKTPKISLRGIFYNPLEVVVYPSCGEVDYKKMCNPLDVNTYTDENLTDYVLERIFEKIIRNKQVAPSDNLNNDHLDRQEVIKQKQ